MRNTGTATWSRADSFKLGAVGDEDPLFDSDDVRVWLDEDIRIEPGQLHPFTIHLLAPDTPGPLVTDWQMVHEDVAWFGEVVTSEVNITCADEDIEDAALPLPDMFHVVEDLAAERPDLLAGSCIREGGSWDFLDLLVDRLRETDERWGYNWKRGVEGDPSHDCVDYHYGSDTREGSTNVYIIDVIVDHCGSPSPGWTDQTEATAEAGTIGRWTGRDRF